MARFSPRGPPMYTEEYRLRGILSPRVGRPLSNAALKASPPSSPRSNAERVLVSPRLPDLDGRKVRGIRPVAGQTSLSRVSITADVPYKAEFTDWGDFVQTNTVPGGDVISTNWTSVAEMEKAKTMRQETDRMQKESALLVFAQESGRQGEEEPKLEKAFFHHTAELQQEWDAKFVSFDERVADRRAKFGMELDAEEAFLQRELDTTLRQRRPKYTPETISMIHGVEVLAKLHKYEEWQELHRRTEIRKAAEAEKFNAEINAKCDVRLGNLAAQHKKALKAFDDKYASLRWKMVHERTTSFAQMRQRYKNNLADMRAAHAREFIDLSDRIPNTPVRPRTSYLNVSSSFRGTHMCRKLQVQIESDRIAKAGLLLN